MALGTFTLVVDGEQLGGNDETTARLRLTFQGRSALKDAEADKFLFLNDTGRPAGAAISLPYTIVLPTDVTEGVSEEIGYTATLTTENGSKVTSKFAARPNGATVTLSDLTDTVISPVGDTGAAVAAAQAAAQAAVEAAASIDVAITGKVDKDSIVVNVKDHGATGDGTTDDTTALNAAVTAGAGGTVLVPEGTYMVAGPTSVLLNQPGTHLMLDAGATLKVIPNNLATEYAVVRVTAADCAVTGGTILGDVVGHVGSTGQYGYGILIKEGAHRFTVTRTRLVQHWGDGIILDGTAAGAAPEDVHLVGIVCDDNRRQGVSVTAAKRLRILGGSFINTGRTLASSPSCGVLFEPSGGSRAIVDALVIGAVARNNVGGGFNNNGLNGATDAVFSGCRSVGNATGFSVTENAQTQIVGCKANANAGNGFTVSPTTSKPVTIEGSVADGNTGYGFQIGGADNGHTVQACQALNNGNSGFIMGRNSSGTGLTAVGNNTATQFFGQITVDSASGVRLTGCVSDVGTNATKPTRGYRLTATATDTVLTGCIARGTFASGSYSDIGTGNMAFPIPGVAKQTGTPAAATDAATTQTLVNDLRTKLLALGIIA